MRDYFGIALQYIDDVLTGNRPANIYEKLACKRQLDDLQRENFEYRFDVEKAARICRFIERLPHIKGRWGGKLIVLQPWQIFILTTVFGWLDERGMRRFKTAYLEIPRKNAKSTITSGVGLYLAFADDEPGAEVYSAATTREQARIVWKDAKRMAEKTPGLRARFGVQISSNAIYSAQNDSTFLSLSRDTGGNLDGLNVHGGLIDELHGHKTRDVFDVIETGTGSRDQPLIWAITTAGSNRAGICYEQRGYAIKILGGQNQDESYFGIIYTIDEGDDFEDETVWAKANPNLDVSVSREDLRRKVRKAVATASAKNNVLTKHFNVWVNAEVAWMNMSHWNKCANHDLTLDDFAGRDCYIALDLASKVDIACKAYIFPGEEKWAIFVVSYLPEEAIENSGNSQYEGWESLGLIKVTDGAMTDYKLIEDELREDAEKFNVKEVAYDPWQANYLSSNLMNEGLTMIEVRPTVKHMSSAMKELEGRIAAQKIEHAGCPVIEWMMSNVVCVTDVRDNIYPRKEKPENKIDGPVAVIMAMGRALVPDDESSCVSYEL